MWYISIAMQDRKKNEALFKIGISLLPFNMEDDRKIDSRSHDVLLSKKLTAVQLPVRL